MHENRPSYGTACFSACQRTLPKGVPPPEGGGIKFRSVISADTPQGGFSCPCGAIHLLCGGNDTSRADQPDFFARNRGLACVHPDSKKWLCHFFDSLRPSRGTACFLFIRRRRRSPPPPAGRISGGPPPSSAAGTDKACRRRQRAFGFCICRRIGRRQRLN